MKSFPAAAETVPLRPVLQILRGTLVLSTLREIRLHPEIPDLRHMTPVLAGIIVRILLLPQEQGALYSKL